MHASKLRMRLIKKYLHKKSNWGAEADQMFLIKIYSDFQTGECRLMIWVEALIKRVSIAVACSANLLIDSMV